MNHRHLAAAISGVILVIPASGAHAGAAIAWRARFEAPRIDHRCAVGLDGTVYAQDSRGVLHAISPAGAPLWSYNPGGVAEGPVAVGHDGTVYIAANPPGLDVKLHAVNPDGSGRWVFTDTNTQGVLAGPGVGPDGRVYLATEAITGFGGRGAIALNPDGSVAWSQPGSPSIIQDDGFGAEIVFGPRQHAGAIEHFYLATDGSRRLYAFSLGGAQRFAALIGNNNASYHFQPGVGANGDVYLPSLLGVGGLRLRAYAPDDGALRWEYPNDPVNIASEVDVGPDGTIYLAFGGAVDAVNPNGTQRWRHNETGVYDGPVVSPDNTAVVVGGVVTFGQAGFIKGLDLSGATRWRIELQPEQGFNQSPQSRARFTTDSRRFYISADFPGMSPQSAYCYLYAVNLGPALPGDANGDCIVNFADLNACLSNFGLTMGATLAQGDVSGDGAVNFTDLNIILANFGIVCRA